MSVNFGQGSLGQITQETAPDDTFDWTINQGETESKFTGPDTDHTRGTADGYYAYIETSDPRVCHLYFTNNADNHVPGQLLDIYIYNLLFDPTTMSKISSMNPCVPIQRHSCVIFTPTNRPCLKILLKAFSRN